MSAVPATDRLAHQSSWKFLRVASNKERHLRILTASSLYSIAASSRIAHSTQSGIFASSKQATSNRLRGQCSRLKGRLREHLMSREQSSVRRGNRQSPWPTGK